MLNELIDRYSQYSDSELMEVYLNKKRYTEDARKALEIVIEKKGGIQSLNNRYDEIVKKENEKSRVNKKASKLYRKGMTQNDIRSHLHSEILSTEDIKSITEAVSSQLEAYWEE
ncbi:hypothetical protein [Chryseobacterium wanjuense]